MEERAGEMNKKRLPLCLPLNDLMLVFGAEDCEGDWVCVCVCGCVRVCPPVFASVCMCEGECERVWW